LNTCSSQKTYHSIDDLKISKNDFIDNFRQINDIVEKKYSHLKNKNINLDSLSKVYETRIASTSLKENYILLLMEYFSQLKNSHSGLRVRPYVIQASAKKIGDHVYINSLQENALEKAGVKKYDEILRIDDRPVLSWLKQQEKYVSASTVQDRDERVLRRLFRNEIKLKRKYEIQTEKGLQTIEIEFNRLWKSSKNKNYSPVKSKVIKDSIGYIELLTMTNSLEDFKREYEKIHTLPYLIIDIRRNGGGNSRNSEKIASYLLKTKQIACVSRKKLKPRHDGFKGKLYVLTSAYTFSAAESFALDLMESKSAVFIGSETGGDTGNRTQVFKTSHGFSFRIPTRKPPQVSSLEFPMEGMGVKPDFEIKLTKEDYFKGIDTVLKFVIKYIEKSQ